MRRSDDDEDNQGLLGAPAAGYISILYPRDGEGLASGRVDARRKTQDAR